MLAGTDKGSTGLAGPARKVIKDEKMSSITDNFGFYIIQLPVGERDSELDR